MSAFLKYNTTSYLRVGPFVDVTDGFTPETGITLSGADQAELLKEGSGATVDISGNTWAAITGCDGWYLLTLTAGNVDTVGNLTVVVQDASVCLPVFARATVLPAQIYDSLIAGSDTLQVDTTQIANSNVSTSTAQLGVNVVNAGGAAITSASGRMEVNTTHIAGAIVNAATAQLGVNVVNFGGSAGTFASGIPSVNASAINGVATTSVTAVAANIGSSQPLQFTGTGASATVKSDLTNIATAAVSASTAQLGVNVVNFGGSAGTFASGRPDVNMTYIAGAVVNKATAQIGANIVEVIEDPVMAGSSQTTNWGGSP